MKRDTKIVMAVVSAIPIVILSASMVCSWAIAHGASMRWRLVFRLMCHGIPSRCLDLFGVPMPICARCVGIYAGLLAGLIAFWLLPIVTERVMRTIAFIAVTPLAIDGLTQLVRLRESTNPLRLATGIAAGLAFGMWVLSAVERRGEERLSTS
ncbi:MAG: hypothetical protein DMF56_15625 [Acidobacteria bacterium]|nr:MAG: hypothetical protein DMF56_15625 [Acidobacteriota bacterium]